MHNSSVNWSYVQTLRAEIVYSSSFLNMTVIINLNLNIPCFPQPQLKMLHTFIPSNEPDIKQNHRSIPVDYQEEKCEVNTCSLQYHGSYEKERPNKSRLSSFSKSRG